jgi:hypothetical protein
MTPRNDLDFGNDTLTADLERSFDKISGPGPDEVDSAIKALRDAQAALRNTDLMRAGSSRAGPRSRISAARGNRNHDDGL